MAAEQQRPIGSGYGPRTTARAVVAETDLGGRNLIVTGGYSGIGIETVRALAAAGAEVTVPARDPARAETALAGVERVTIAHMDLADLASVRRFGRDWLDSARPLHGLINNAGVMASPLTRVGPGWEQQFAVCHLGHFALATALERAFVGGSRVVALSSIAHARSDVLWDDPHFERTPYDKWVAYGQAKTADALFALALDARWHDRGVHGFSVHPGGILTPLQRHLPTEEMVALGWTNPDGTVADTARDLFKTPEQGAATTCFALLDPRLDALGGVYCEDGDVAMLADASAPRWAGVRPHACDPARAERLWEMSEAMIAGVGAA